MAIIKIVKNGGSEVSEPELVKLEDLSKSNINCEILGDDKNNK